MRRDQLEHAIRAATDVLDADAVVIIGSQAVLGSLADADLPHSATLSMEVDVLPLDDPDETKADLLDGAIGEGSMFHESHGFYVQGVGQRTAVLPRGWRGRLVELRNENTNGRGGWCLELHDLGIAKLVAGRPKDLRFCADLIAAGRLDVQVLGERLAVTRVAPTVRTRIEGWLDASSPRSLRARRR